MSSSAVIVNTDRLRRPRNDATLNPAMLSAGHPLHRSRPADPRGSTVPPCSAAITAKRSAILARTERKQIAAIDPTVVHIVLEQADGDRIEGVRDSPRIFLKQASACTA